MPNIIQKFFVHSNLRYYFSRWSMFLTFNCSWADWIRSTVSIMFGLRTPVVCILCSYTRKEKGELYWRNDHARKSHVYNIQCSMSCVAFKPYIKIQWQQASSLVINICSSLYLNVFDILNIYSFRLWILISNQTFFFFLLQCIIFFILKIIWPLNHVFFVGLIIKTIVVA